MADSRPGIAPRKCPSCGLGCCAEGECCYGEGCSNDVIDTPCPACGDFYCVVRTGAETARCRKCGAVLEGAHYV